MKLALKHRRFVGFLPVMLVIFILLLGLMGRRHYSRPVPVQTPLAAAAVAPVQAATTTNPASVPAGTSAKPMKPAILAERPFPVACESSNNVWTRADGKDTNVIRWLAHNPLEFARMVEENPRIYRRQLVYLKKTAAAVLEDAKLTGRPVRQLLLPGLDGQELSFQITQDESQGSSRQGMMSGYLAGNPDSRVTFAFMDGREAYTVLSPKDYLYLVGEPREPGQVIVKAVDPNTYGVGPADAGDDFIRTGSPVNR